MAINIFISIYESYSFHLIQSTSLSPHTLVYTLHCNMLLYHLNLFHFKEGKPLKLPHQMTPPRPFVCAIFFYLFCIIIHSPDNTNYVIMNVKD